MNRYLIQAAIISVLILSFATVLIAKGSNITGKMSKKEKANIETITNLLKGFEEGNIEQVNSLVHEDFVNHHAPEGMQDREGFKSIVASVHGAFSSFDTFNLSPEHLFAKGDYVAMLDLGEGSKNGKEYRHRDIHIFIMKDGKMFEHWNSFGLPSASDNLRKFMEATK